MIEALPGPWRALNTLNHLSEGPSRAQQAIKPTPEGLFPILRSPDGLARCQELTLAAPPAMLGDPASELIARALESGEGEEQIVAALQDGEGGVLLQPIAQGLYLRGCADSGRDAPAAAGLVERCVGQRRSGSPGPCLLWGRQ